MMKEPEHRPLSFRANSFSRFAKKYRISMQAKPIDPFGFIDSSFLREAKDFVITFSRDGHVFTFPFAFLEYRTELPPIEDVLDYLANEAAVVGKFKDHPEKFAEFINSHVEYAAQLIREANDAVAPFSAFIGPEAFAEFVKITEDRQL